MKKITKRYLYLLLLLVAVVGFSSCDDDDIRFYNDHPLYEELSDGYWEIDFGEYISNGEFDIDVVSVFEFNYDSYEGYGYGKEYIKDFSGAILEEWPFKYVVGEGYGADFVEFTYYGESQSEVLAIVRFSKYGLTAIHYDSFSDFKHDAYGNEWNFYWLANKFEPVPTTRSVQSKSVRVKPIRRVEISK